jgi:7-carboxy-7-deazaguanine synthase
VKITEIFYSVQGEGVFTGMPSVFVRTSGCNLRCTWCDTPYTSWSPEGVEMSVADVLAEVRRQPSTHVVVTGGEPMIQPALVELTNALHDSGLHITIETAGTAWAPVACDLMSISPKLANSTPVDRDEGRWAAMHERVRHQPEVLRRLMAEYPYQLKFVIAAPEDMEEVERLIIEVDADRSRVVLMPEGIDVETLAERGRWLVEICKERGYRFSPRLHVMLWGNRRGV